MIREASAVALVLAVAAGLIAADRPADTVTTWTSPDAPEQPQQPGAAAADGPWRAYQARYPAGDWTDHEARYAGYLPAAEAGRLGLDHGPADGSGWVYCWTADVSRSTGGSR